MTTTKHFEGPAMRGIRKFPDGRIARGPKEWGEAQKQWKEKKARDEKRTYAEHMNLFHPEGLAEIRNSVGELIRPRGFRDW